MDVSWLPFVPFIPPHVPCGQSRLAAIRARLFYVTLSLISSLRVFIYFTRQCEFLPKKIL